MLPFLDNLSRNLSKGNEPSMKMFTIKIQPRESEKLQPIFSCTGVTPEHLFQPCWFRWIVVVGLIVSLTGCLGIQRIQGPIIHYQLNPEVVTVPCMVKGDSVLEVMPFVASAPYDSTGLVYSQGEHRAEPSIHFRWVAPPERMLREYLIQTLGKLPQFSAVIGQESSLRPHYLLEGRVFALDSFSSSSGTFARLHVEIALIRAKDKEEKEMKVVFRRRYNVEIPIQGSEGSPPVSKAVEGLNKALQTFSKSLQQDLCKLAL